jgi:hypothetical protein
VLVTGLTDKGAAIEAGIKEGDVIVAINGEGTLTVPELQEEVSQYRPGDQILVSVVRENKKADYKVILRNKIGTTAIYRKADFDASALLQAELVELDRYQLRKYRLNSGIQIVDFTGDKLKSLGVKKGFIITHIDRVPVSSKEQVAQLLLNSEDGILLSGIYPGGQKAYYGLGV